MAKFVALRPQRGAADLPSPNPPCNLTINIVQQHSNRSNPIKALRSSYIPEARLSNRQHSLVFLVFLCSKLIFSTFSEMDDEMIEKQTLF